MNENEGGMKRAKEQEAPNVDIEHKRHKLNDEEAITKVAAIPCVPSTLVLDKSQQDTIKELLQSSNVSSVQGKKKLVSNAIRYS